MTPFEVLREIRRRSAEAIVSQSGIRHSGLSRNLRKALTGDDPKAGSLLQQPFIEGAHPFVSAPDSLDSLRTKLLNSSFVDAIDTLPEGHEYRFPKERRPYAHQLESWQLLADKRPRSVLVTSGTGSGKTECFLFPILSSLLDEVTTTREALTGVQAIMLYPLNALIESQRERLSAWTGPFGGQLRYCLYNGDLPRAAKESDRRRSPEQVIDREQLRSSPPPILVTNTTMLEYMLVRAEDRPIVQSSKGKLRWIVLDEAHSFVGAAAAEIALLLRRVMIAFSVEPEDVRFIATSATIGSGDTVKQELRQFLADIAGVAEDQVFVVEGARQRPIRSTNEAELNCDIRTASPDQLYNFFSKNDETWSLVNRLYGGSVPLSDFDVAASKFSVSTAELVVLLSQATRQVNGGESERLAPVRLHAFERAMPGLWSCINPLCSQRHDDWPFGNILTQRADECPSCSAPVLEIVSCGECGEVYLEGTETARQLSPPLRNPPRDEFAFDSAREGTDASETDGDDSSSDQMESVASWDRLICIEPSASSRPIWIDPLSSWRIVDAEREKTITLWSEEHIGSRACPKCTPEGGQTRELIRPLRFGAPFIIGNAAPILLEGVEAAKGDARSTLPSEGRRLLSFTDSRQGTARMSAKLQIESERNFVRSFVYHQVQLSMRPTEGSDVESQALLDEIGQLESAYEKMPLPTIANEILRRKNRLSELSSGSTKGIAWLDLVERLAERIEVSDWIKGVWIARDEQLFSDATKVAHFLLLREFDRRPKSSASLETLGFAKLLIPYLDNLTDSSLPPVFVRRGLSLADWRAYLYTVLTHFIRNSRFASIEPKLLHWISHRAVRRSLVGPNDEITDKAMQRGWPNGYFRASKNSRPVNLLLQGLKLSLDSPADRSDLDDCLQAAWRLLSVTFSPDPERNIFDYTKSCVAPIVDAFLCPVTRRILDCAPFGLTPYGLSELHTTMKLASPLAMPKHPRPMIGAFNRDEARQRIQAWVVEDPAVQKLRASGAWNNISDRIALFAEYARSAEHSAQQDSSRLRRYEQEFKDGRINILNCSTTMEMGVDIGSVSSVMMTNVPPSIANYRQRVGRAGRRGQAIAVGFTFCKDRPLDREAFRDPQAYLSRTLSAPRVSLSSRPIVQRHVNALLLSRFMAERSGNAVKMQIGAFLGCPADSKIPRHARSERPVQDYIDWLASPETTTLMSEPIKTLVRRSVLDGDARLIVDSRTAIEALEERFISEWNALVSMAKDEGAREAGKARMEIEIRRLCGEFLLGALADRGYLPGYGFPTDVVSFMPAAEFRPASDNASEGNRQFRSVGPQRSLDLAIRDYAPGSEVVLDGLVHKSAGVTLNWKRPASEENVAEIQSIRFAWHCAECGAADIQRGGYPSFCPSCGSESLHSIEFLRPAGFAVDPRIRPHAETDSVSYIAPEDPIVSTRDTEWNSLPLPELGRYRSSREGLVYFSNKGGPNGSGFAICLHCGRAEADSDNRGLVAPPPILVGHKPLRYRKGEDVCPGNDRPFSIKRNIALGLEITTDVFELQPRQPISRSGANALVIALREALAQELGVEADEMGFVASEAQNAFGAAAVSLFIYDRATGGAGFAVSFEDRIKPVIARAERILDCKTPGCEKACAACVLTSDAPTGKDELDRTLALAFLREHLVFPSGLSADDSWGEDSEISLSPLREISRELGRIPRSKISIFVPEGFSPSELTAWRLGTEFQEWTKRGHVVRLVLTPSAISSLSSAERLSLRDFSVAHGVTLHLGVPPELPNGSHPLIAIYTSGEVSHIWATHDVDAALPGGKWGHPTGHPIVHGTAPFTLSLNSVDLNSLLPPPGAHLVQIGSELDGSMSTFGLRFTEILVGALKKCGIWPNGAIRKAIYRDPYVSSPLVARLLIDTAAKLLELSGSKDPSLLVETRIRGSEMRGDPWQISHDWRDGNQQRGVLESLGRTRGLKIQVNYADVPHGRYLELIFETGQSAMIVLDQGFGAWVPPRTVVVRHDFCSDIDSETRRLATVNSLLERRGPGKTYVVAAPGKA
jgi:DEAD/DEAH box helicase domain-containing protein